MIEKITKHINKEFGFLDEDTQKRLVNTAVSSFHSVKEDLKKVLETENKDEILKVVHKFKGILLNFGLSEFANEFNDKELKKYSLEKIKNKLDKSIEKIDNAFNK